MNGEPSGIGAETPDFLFSQSMAALQKGDVNRAISFGDRLITLSCGAVPAIVWGVRLRLEAKRFQGALDLALPSLDRSPGLSGLAGHAYEGLGDLAAAQRCFERAAGEQPENPMWWLHNASTLSRLYRDFESMESLRCAVALGNAVDPSSLLILAGQELQFGNPEPAIEAAERALALNPRLEGAHPLVARSLMEMGRPAEAEKRWNRAISGEPRNRALPLQKAVSLIRHGQFERGTEELGKMLASNPRFVPALVQMATAKRLGEEDRAQIDLMEEVLQDPGIGDDDRIALGYALGKAHENLKQYETAFKHFDRANSIQYRAIEESGGFDRPGYTANMDLRIQVYARQVADALAPQGDPSDAPIFVLGVIRSGTTLAEQILSSHPMVSGAGELDFWINADLRLMDYRTRALEVAALRQAGPVYARLLHGFARDGAKRVVDKQPGNLILAGALHIAFPNARIIHMCRNPVDTAISIWSTHVRTSTRFVHDKGNIAYAFGEHERLLQHWRQTIPSDRLMDVSYEELVLDRENVTRKMLEFCGLPWSDECLTPEKNRKMVNTPSLWQVRQPVYRTSIDRWRRYEPWLGEFAQLLPRAEA